MSSKGLKLLKLSLKKTIKTDLTPLQKRQICDHKNKNVKETYDMIANISLINGTQLSVKVPSKILLNKRKRGQVTTTLGSSYVILNKYQNSRK